MNKLNLYQPISKKIAYSILSLFVALAGFLVVKNNTYSADTVLIKKNLLVIGKVIDVTTSKPIANAELNIISIYGEGTAKVKTNKNGDYKAVVKVDGIRGADYLSYIVTAKDYQLVNTLQSVIYNGVPKKDIYLSKTPRDVVTGKELDTVSSRCRTTPYSYQVEGSWIHSGDYKGKIINGVLFCTQEQNANFFSQYRILISTAATQIYDLKAKTGLPFMPTVYLVDRISWLENADAYVTLGSKEIVLTAINMNQGTVSHEFAHLLDWELGFSSNFLPYCNVIKDENKKHCRLSSRSDFLKAFTNLENDKLISGYATTNAGEAFAELFAAQNTRDYILATDYNSQERLKYSINNAILGQYTDIVGPIAMGSNTEIVPDLNRTPSSQNTIMYMYKFVAQAGKNSQYFSGNLSEWYNSTNIANGDFMNTSVVSVRVLDSKNNPVGGVPLVIGGVSGTSLYKKDSNVFTNGTGDLFNTTGTLVLRDVKPGIVAVSLPKLPAGKTYFPKSVILKKGANKVINIRISDVGVVNNQDESVIIRPNSQYLKNLKPYFNSLPTSKNNWEMVDEVTPDNDASYVSITDNFGTDLYGHKGGEVPAGSIIKSVTVNLRLSGSMVIGPRIFTGGKEIATGRQSNSGQFGWFDGSYTWEKNPTTGKDWTVQEINNLKFGAYVGVGAGTAKLSQVYAKVNFTLP